MIFTSIVPASGSSPRRNGDVPDTLAVAGAIDDRGPDGTATLNCLAAKDQLMAGNGSRQKNFFFFFFFF